MNIILKANLNFLPKIKFNSKQGLCQFVFYATVATVPQETVTKVEEFELEEEVETGTGTRNGSWRRRRRGKSKLKFYVFVSLLFI